MQGRNRRSFFTYTSLFNNNNKNNNTRGLLEAVLYQPYEAVVRRQHAESGINIYLTGGSNGHTRSAVTGGT